METTTSDPTQNRPRTSGFIAEYVKFKSIFTQIDSLSTEGMIRISVNDKLIVQRDGDAKSNPLIFHTNRCDVIIAIGLALANNHVLADAKSSDNTQSKIDKSILTGAYQTLDILRSLDLINPKNKIDDNDLTLSEQYDNARHFRNTVAVSDLPLHAPFELYVNDKKRHYREEENGPIFMDGRFSDEIVAIGIALARSTADVNDVMLMGACTFLDDMDARAVQTHGYSHSISEQNTTWKNVTKGILLPENAVRPLPY